MSKLTNIAISKFMGKYPLDLKIFADAHCGISSEKYSPTGLGLYYDTNWDWLMLVVQKIEDLLMPGIEDIMGDKRNVDWSFAVEIKNKQCMIHRYCSPQYYGESTDFLKLYDCRNTSKIKAVHLAVVTFIKWHNKTMKSKRNKYVHRTF